jgi:ATP-dependent DNA helicase RecG
LVYETAKGDCFLRIGDSNKKLTFNDRAELEYDKGIKQFDGWVVKEEVFSELDDKLVAEYANVIGEFENPYHALEARRLILNGKQTNACHLLFATDPTDIFVNARIRIIKFISNERGSGDRLNIEFGKDIVIEKPIPSAIREAFNAIDDFVIKRETLSEDGIFRSSEIIPREAWQEGLVNAVIHRSYSNMGDYIRVEIYPNRIEIENPGKFIQLSPNIDLLNLSRFARNPNIARVCTELKIGMELGEGIRRIVRNMREKQYIDPIYIQKQNSVKLILEAEARLNESLVKTLPVDSERVYNYIRTSADKLGTGDISELADMKRPTVLKRLNALERAGLIRRIGKSPTDPRAIWEVV